jgi:[calcium/calmodulin-dependent protein kinase] kinase
VPQYLEGGISMDYDKKTKRFRSPLTGGVLPPPTACKLFFGLVAGLQYLHGKGICHRDIKVRHRPCPLSLQLPLLSLSPPLRDILSPVPPSLPPPLPPPSCTPQPENLLLTDGTKLRITDFGCAQRIKDTGEGGEGESRDRGKLFDTSGTYNFLAPECCSGEGFFPWPVDVWAAGLCLYCFLFGRLPFQKAGLAPLFAAIQEEEVQIPPVEEEGEGGAEGGENGEREAGGGQSVEPELHEMLEGLFLKDPGARWTLERLRAHSCLAQARREDEDEDRRRDEEEERERREREEREREGRNEIDEGGGGASRS